VNPEQGTQRYFRQAACRSYSSLIDTWNAGGRTRDALDCAELAVRQGVWDNAAQRDRDHVPGLRARPVHDAGEFWFVAHLERRFPEIQAEIRRVVEAPSDPVRPTVEDGWLLHSGSWEQAYLFREGRWQEEVCRHFPLTRAILAEIPEITTFSPGVILVSRLSPGTHIMAHCGSTNAILRIHLPITVPDGVWLRVADQTLRWEEGRCLVFDDSFEHEVRHEGTADRVVLIFDMAHPDLDDAHRQRLLDNRPSPQERIAAFMREHGLARVNVENGRVVFTPDATVSRLVTRYLAAAEVSGVRLHGDEVHWQPATGEA
jgi:aspartate beta-hydroxylase